MPTLHIVRHGETIWHAENRYAGHTDVALTARGVQQGIDLVPWVKSQQIDAVATSDLSRAVLTAQPAATALGIELRSSPMLREVNFGAGEGLTAQEMVKKFPREREAFELHPASSPFPGGESGLDALERALPVLAELLSEDGVETVLTVIHSTLGRLLLCEFLGIQLDRYRSVFPRFVNGAVTTVRFDHIFSADSLRSRGSLLALNAPAHSPKGIT